MIAKTLTELIPLPFNIDSVPKFEYILMTLLTLLFFIPSFWYLFRKLFRDAVDKNLDFLQAKATISLPIIWFLLDCLLNPYLSNINNPAFICLNLALILVLFLGSYTSYVIVLRVLTISHEKHLITEKNLMTSKQLEMQKYSYELLSKSIADSERQRHDWKQHNIIISEYTNSGEYEKLKEYLSRLSKETSETKELSVCQNPVVDSLLRYYLSNLQNEGIKLDIKIALPGNIEIPDTELCVIFGNLIENAAEACHNQQGEYRYIKIRSYIKGRQFILFIENSHEQTVTIDDGVYISSKQNGRKGIGISSVQSIVEQKNGSIKITFDREVFKVYILININ